MVGPAKFSQPTPSRSELAILNISNVAASSSAGCICPEHVDHVAVWSAHRLLDDHFVHCVNSDLTIVADANLRVGGHRPAVWIGQRYLGLTSSFEFRRHHFVVAALLA